MIIKNAFQNFSTGLNQPFNLTIKFSYNFTYWPRIDDVILRGLTESTIPAGNKKISFNEIKEEEKVAFYQPAGSAGSLLKISLTDQVKPLVKADEVYFLDRVEMWSKLLNGSSD